jgi:hypothetical protein
MLVRLTVKLAEQVDGIDLSHCDEGSIIQLSRRDGLLLIAEGWAERVAGERRVSRCTGDRSVAADRPGRRPPRRRR